MQIICIAKRRRHIAELQLTSIGDSVGVIFPKELLARLGLQKGDVLFAVETPDGLRLSVSDPDHEAQMADARRLMEKWHPVLRELAK